MDTKAAAQLGLDISCKQSKKVSSAVYAPHADGSTQCNLWCRQDGVHTKVATQLGLDRAIGPRRRPKRPAGKIPQAAWADHPLGKVIGHQCFYISQVAACLILTSALFVLVVM